MSLPRRALAIRSTRRTQFDRLAACGKGATVIGTAGVFEKHRIAQQGACGDLDPARTLRELIAVAPVAAAGRRTELPVTIVPKVVTGGVSLSAAPCEARIAAWPSVTRES